MDFDVDARGLSCPQPVMLTRKALQEAGERDIVVLVDSLTQVQNITRAAAYVGWQAAYEEQGDAYLITVSKK